MNFNTHSNLEGKHSFLSPSNYHWLRYDMTKIRSAYLNSLAAKDGTELHEIAARLIRRGINLPKSRKTLNLYVNDAIGYRMNAEVLLYYSDNCFGTADAIGYRNKKLRIHDLKTGISPASMEQLEIYAALFFLEYPYIHLEDTDIELRIYQGDDVIVEEPDKDTIQHIMNHIIAADKEIEKVKEEV